MWMTPQGCKIEEMRRNCPSLLECFVLKGLRTQGGLFYLNETSLAF